MDLQLIENEQQQEHHDMPQTCFVIVAESTTKRIPLEPGPYLQFHFQWGPLLYDGDNDKNDNNDNR